MIHVRRFSPRLFFAICLIVLLIWPAQQLIHFFHGREHKGNATYLLYQVSSFQLELLNSYINDASTLTDTDKLDMLKQADYTMGYTYERLQLAVGRKQLTPINSFAKLSQYLMRLQIGGNRTLTSEEKQEFQQVAASFSKLYTDYGHLITDKGRVVRSENHNIQELDQKITASLKQQLMK